MIYLDNAATTPLDENVLNKMLPYLRGSYANPASQYKAGRETALALLKARDKSAQLIGCKPEELFFCFRRTPAPIYKNGSPEFPGYRGIVLDTPPDAKLY